MFFNGVWEDGCMMELLKDSNGYVHVTRKEEWTMNLAESDTKIFQLSEKLNEESRIAKERRTLMVHSLDSDVKLLGIYYSNKCESLEIIIKSGTGMIPVYFYPMKMVDYMKNNYVGENMEQICSRLLQTYALWGCDYLPGFFGINHGLGMMSFDEFCKKKVISSTNDFLELIMTTYQNKNSLLKRLFPKCTESVYTRIMNTREVIKAARGVEHLTIPLPSVLELQVLRSEYVAKMWTSFGSTLNPENFGWKKTEDGFAIKLQDTTDTYYTLTKHVLEGCGCKNICGKTCKCLKMKERAHKCTSLTCR